MNRELYKNLSRAALILALAAGSHGALAKEYNRSNHVDAGAQVKVTKAIAEAHRRGGEGEKSRFQLNQGCGNLNIGNVEVAGARAPREVVTVVTGDVININRGGCN